MLLRGPAKRYCLFGVSEFKLLKVSQKANYMNISLPKLLDQAWSLLEEGQADGQSPFRLMSLATVDGEGQPKARHVVLRGVDRGAKNLEFHTDISSSKCAELQANPQAQLLFWDPDRAICDQNVNDIIKRSVVKVKRCERPGDLGVSRHSPHMGAADD